MIASLSVVGCYVLLRWLIRDVGCATFLVALGIVTLLLI